MRTVIGIPVPTSADPEYNTRSLPQYVRAVEAAGASALPLPLGVSLDELGLLADRCSGFVLPGSPADVTPALYGAVRQAATAPADVAREECDSLLLRHAAVQGKPVLAICFGMQMLNVWSGGDLVQDLAPVPVNHAAGASVAVAHAVRVERESLLAGLLTATEAPGEGSFRRLPINTSHHQSVGVPGQGLAVVARSAEDGVVEAVEGRIGDAAMIGVQWHPERSIEISAASRALFTWLISEAKDRASHLTLEGQPDRVH